DGLDRLMAVGASLAGVPTAQVCDRLVADMGAEAPQTDDFPVLPVRFKPNTREPFQLTFRADSSELRTLRASLRAWLEERSCPALAQDAVIVATNEACSNAIEHAYRGRLAGDVTVLVEQAEGELAVTVRDYGRFMPISESPANRGRGTMIMEKLTAGFTRDSDRAGTTVRFQVPVTEVTA